MGRAEPAPIDDDAENAQIRPLEACMPCQFRVTYRRYINPFRQGTDTTWGALPDRMAPQAGLFFKMLLLISACVNACTAIPASNLYTEHSLFEGRLSIHA